MLEGLEALIALERCGTVSEAAVSLRLTQSAVTKRIQALQHDVGFRLTEPEGRKIRLTAEALNYIERARPLLLELKALALPQTGASSPRLSLAMADSIASSWGPGLLKKVKQDIPDLDISLHSHRSALIIESVRLGRYHMGLCTTASSLTDLISFPVFSESFVLLNSELKEKPDFKKPLITIESGSATWPAIAEQVKTNVLLSRMNIGMNLIRVESFSAAFQMVTAGFGNGLIPAGMVHTMKTKSTCYKTLSVKREISLITRKTLSNEETFKTFLSVLKLKKLSV